MNFKITARGEVIESQELLNGTRTVAFEAVSDDGWLLTGVVAWNRGLVDFEGEGDLTLSREDRAEIYASLVRATLHDDVDSPSLECIYEVDGGAGEFDRANGVAAAQIRLAVAALELTLDLDLELG